jgi:DNA polymerase III delta subunit
MLHIFLGDNESDVRIEARKFARELSDKKKCVLDEPENVYSWEEIIFSKSLFGPQTLTFFDINQKDFASDFLKNKEKFESSENIFVFSAKSSLVKSEGLKSDKNFVLHEVKNGVLKKEFANVFGLSDAVARRDKKQAWLLYRKFIEEGLSPEEIHGTIFWQIKSLAIVEVSNDYTEAKMKPFVFTKAKSFLKKFKEGEVKSWLGKLVEIYHKSHRGEYTLENALEIFILGV